MQIDFGEKSKKGRMLLKKLGIVFAISAVFNAILIQHTNLWYVNFFRKQNSLSTVHNQHPHFLALVLTYPLFLNHNLLKNILHPKLVEGNHFYCLIKS